MSSEINIFACAFFSGRKAKNSVRKRLLGGALRQRNSAQKDRKSIEKFCPRGIIGAEAVAAQASGLCAGITA